MWKFTANTVHGKTLHYSARSREAARVKRAHVARAPFVLSTTTPAR